ESPTDTEAVESAVQALLADIEVHPSPSSLADEPISVPEDVAKDVPTLRLEVARLRRDLDATRRVLRASPSAADNMLLRDEIEDKDKELARLQESAFERDRGLTEARKRLEDLARQVLAGKLEKQRLSRSIDDQKARIETAETMLALAEDEIKELREQTDGEISRERAAHQATREDLERRLSEITTALEETKRGGAELQRRREGLERRIEELETARIETLREKEESLARMREEQAAAAFDLELKFESALMEKEREHEAAVAARLEAASEESQARIARREADFRADLDDAHVRHEKALAALRKIHTDMLAEKDLVLDTTRARVVEIEQALARSEHDRGAAQDRIGSLEETLRAQIEDLARARQSLEESERGGEEARRRLADFEKERVATEHAHQEALQKLRHENSVIIEALQRERREDVAAQREHERQMIEARKMEHRTTLQKTTEEIDLLRAQSHERETALQERHERRISEIERKTEEAIRRLTKENEEAKARIARAEEDLAAAKRDLAERDEEIADQRGTISSLQALVGDFSTPATGAPSRPKIENT
ncbi:MAG: hypothetical protein JXO72_02415, partial [Vicinamibacteria bacterium]|nr:hypothetical protein [Vicinamibacteria bacterium]